MGHLTPEQIKEYQQQELGKNELIEIAAHLHQCSKCQEQIQSTGLYKTAFSTLKSEMSSSVRHLSDDEFFSFIDGATNQSDNAEMEKHLNECAECQKTIDELREDQKLLKVVSFNKKEDKRKNYRSYLLAAALVFAALAAALVIRQNILVKPESVLVLQDGERRITMTADSITGLSGVSPDLLARIKSAVQSGKLQIPNDLNELKPGEGTMLGPAEKAAYLPVSPVGIRILSDQPVLNWKQFQGANSYVIVIADKNSRAVAISASLTNTSWKISQPLNRGERYSWQVTAIVKDEEITSPQPPAPEALFEVIHKEDADAIYTAQQKNSSHLLLAVLYANAGLLEDARKELGILKTQNPNSKIIEDLQKDLERNLAK